MSAVIAWWNWSLPRCRGSDRLLSGFGARVIKLGKWSPSMSCKRYLIAIGGLVLVAFAPAWLAVVGAQPPDEKLDREVNRRRDVSPKQPLGNPPVTTTCEPPLL